ncbi:MAG: FtsQ-type POTRA domain-containing protein [Endomicrobium sp.]|jgi:cell division protein FtsQ|nr:FtsQ-type POTRA domain-containing protein [Endomicrobium sp.]MDR2251930.1 FtsQ-type POTRA domain-containing protein [Endomicrobium sp.]MDR2818357.1 FtsQ-type POTRA domain-containing protein [Endomicrobium sp.]
MTAKKRNRYVYKAVHTNSGYSRNKKVRKFFKIFFYLVFFGGIVYGLYFGINELLSIVYKSDKIIIKDINIVGAKNITKAEIKELIPFKIGDNLLKVKLSETESEIKKLKPELKNIVINRRWQKIKIKLYERTPEAFVMQNGEIRGIDFDDKPFPLRGFMSEMKIPKIVYKNDEERKRLLDFIKRFKFVCDGFLDNILEMRINNTDDIIFVTADNMTIIWGEEMPEHLPNKFKKFRKVYEDAISRYKQIEYINMNLYSSGRIIVKPGAGILAE